MPKKLFCEVSSRQKRRRILKELTTSSIVPECNCVNAISADTYADCLSLPLSSNRSTSGEFENTNSLLTSVHSTITCDSSEISDTTSIRVCETNCELITENHNESFSLSEFKNKLRSWASFHSVSHMSISNLLSILRTVNVLSGLPQDARTLMQTPRNATENIIALGGGEFVHMGFVKSLQSSLQKHYTCLPTTVKVNLNIDGLPLTKSSSSQFWPILGSIVDSFYTKPFVISVYHGFHKPLSSKDFLSYFVQEARDILENGINYNGSIINVQLNAIICDAPARSYISGVKGHNGYFGCSKCIQEGDYVDNRMTFPEISSVLRTDESFRNKLHVEHHKDSKEANILECLNIGMVTQFPIDYMHAVCIGVTKKLIYFWINGKKDVRLKPNDIQNVTNHLSLLKPSITGEFSRKPRSITEYERWKATELRTFLLYTGPVVLREVLPGDYYDHFLSLSVAIRILCDKNLYIVLNNYAHTILEWFVKKYFILYGEQRIVYNVHSLLHLANDSKLFGPLDEYSAFKFENFMQIIKKKVKNSSRPLQQLFNRLMEEESLQGKSNCTSEANKMTSKLSFEGFTISQKPHDNCFEHENGDVMEVVNISMKDCMINAQKYQKVETLFTAPCNSVKLGICIVKQSDLRQDIDTIDKKCVKRKCLKLPLYLNSSGSVNEHAIFPLIHSDGQKDCAQWKKDTSSKQYAVVRFDDESVSEVPITWLFDNNRSSWWPRNSKVATSYINRYSPPDPDSWSKYSVVAVEAICDSLEVARKKAEDIHYSEGEDKDRGRGKRLVQRSTLLSNFIDGSNNGSSDSDVEARTKRILTPPPELPPDLDISSMEMVILNKNTNIDTMNEQFPHGEYAEDEYVEEYAESYAESQEVPVNQFNSQSINRNGNYEISVMHKILEMVTEIKIQVNDIARNMQSFKVDKQPVEQYDIFTKCLPLNSFEAIEKFEELISDLEINKLFVS
ncbi:hypothetical protein PPYR_01428 [Photinus pyralis]|uniref:Transposase domain-containing protein n=1 Tax=Photinus pyralis TaxID=7054 RepID=A0A5N4B4J7_PHOPY|nr:hypothetical protein PPYR_01428 [Photinus pyralis]